MTPTNMAMEIVKWLKERPDGTSYSYDDICGEIRRRWPELDDTEIHFVFKKTINLFAFE